MIVSTQQNLGTELDMGSFGAPPRNWRGIGLAMLVIAVVMSIVLLAIFLLSPEIPRQPEKLYLTLSDLENPDYQVHVPNIYWASDTEIIQETQDGNLIKQNLETKKTTILLSNITYLFVSQNGTNEIYSLPRKTITPLKESCKTYGSQTLAVPLSLPSSAHFGKAE
ncbi:inactive dipeptidyl peptidase 10-like [Ranitomeya imitator]|uniref:inactive dipeptidyl peptidase 10-like n=1 Tax=Ranitomeya imitator TaxID=111125 RepID=UPI0037E92578